MNTKDMAEDAIANAVDAGFQYVECTNCGGGGYWYRDGEANPCPLCDAELVSPQDS